MGKEQSSIRKLHGPSTLFQINIKATRFKEINAAALRFRISSCSKKDLRMTFTGSRSRVLLLHSESPLPLSG